MSSFSGMGLFEARLVDVLKLVLGEKDYLLLPGLIRLDLIDDLKLFLLLVLYLGST